jgi:hypothetical protein
MVCIKDECLIEVSFLKYSGLLDYLVYCFPPVCIGWKLRVFENRVLRRIFGPKSDEVTGEWRKLHNKELHDLYSSPSIIRISSRGG